MQRFLQKRSRAELCRAPGLVGSGSHDEDGHPRGRAAHRVEGLSAVLVRHVQIQQREVRRGGAEVRDGFAPAAGEHDRVMLQFENPAQGLAYGGIIVCQEDFLCLKSRCSSANIEVSGDHANPGPGQGDGLDYASEWWNGSPGIQGQNARGRELRGTGRSRPKGMGREEGLLNSCAGLLTGFAVVGVQEWAREDARPPGAGCG